MSKKAREIDIRIERVIARNKRAVTRAGLSRVDWLLFKKRADRIIRSHHADVLAFHLMELDEACAVFRMKIRRLYRALASATPESAELDGADGEVWTELWHLHYHVSGAFPSAYKLSIKAGRLERGEHKDGKRPTKGKRKSRKKSKKGKKRS